MRYVSWTRRAPAEAGEIRRYIKARDPDAADRLLNRIEATAASLAEFPRKGRLVRRGLRQITVYPYIIRYRIKADLMEIIRVYHGARNVRSPRLDYSAQPAIA